MSIEIQAHHGKRHFVWFFGLVFAAFVVLVGCNENTSETGGRAVKEVSSVETSTVKFPVEGMSCGACAARIKGALKEIDGVAEVEVNLVERSVETRYAPDKVAPDQLAQAINALGYKALTATGMTEESHSEVSPSDVEQ